MDLENVENVDGVLDGCDDDTEMVENIDEDDSNDGDKSLGTVRQREDFTSEIYKIEISNMGNFGYGVGTIFILINQKRMLSESLTVALLPFSHTHTHTHTGNKKIAQRKTQVESIEDQDAAQIRW